MQDYRNVSKRFIILSVFYIVAGFTMMFWPNLTMAVLGKTLGVAMLVVGLAYVVIYFTKDHLQGILEMDLTLGVVLAAFGSFILLHSDFVGLSIPFAVGVIIVIGGISKIQFALDMRRLHIRRWNILLGIAILVMALGILLIFSPFAEQVLLYFMAAGLILDGLTSIISILAIARRLKKMERGQMPPHHGPGGHLAPLQQFDPRSQHMMQQTPHVDGEIVEDK